MIGLLKRGALVLVIAVTLSGAYSANRYPGLSVGLWDHAQEATLAESWNLLRCILYWVEFMEKLQLDPKTGIYGFPAETVGDTAAISCTMHFHRGQFAAAIDCLEGEIERNGPSEKRLFWLAIATMRRAEIENCLDRLVAPTVSETPFALASNAHDHSSRYCTLPIAGQHERRELSRRAAEIFTRLLDEYDREDLLYRWLLNFSYMTIGGFPDEVPERYRIETPFIDHFYGNKRQQMRERYEHLSFSERAGELGIATNDAGRGVAVEDFDGDGWLDLVTGGAFQSLRYYRNDGAGGFIDATAKAGLGAVTQSFAISSADFDNDGWPDLFVSRPFDRYVLLRNQGGELGAGTFIDVTDETGLAAAKRHDEIAASWVSAWGDVDLDGDLDLFLAQWGMELPLVSGLLSRPRMDSKLFINQGGSFVDRTAEYGLAGLVGDEYFVGATFGDFDNDGWTDLFLSSPVRLASLLLKNRQGRRFEPVSLTNRSESGFYAAFVDVNHDGRLDIFQGGFSDARTSTRTAVFGNGPVRFKSGNSTVLLQTPAGTFDEHNEFFEGDMPMATMGASYGDIDNDGCHDFYLGTGNPESWFVLPNLMYVGRRQGHRCTGRLENVSMLEGFGTIQKGHGIVFFDFDNDGDQDVYSALGGMWPADSWPNQFFVNESNLGRSWIKVRLRGRETNHFGVGARIRVSAEAGDGSELVRHFHMDNKTGFGSAPYLAHIGLLDARRIRDVEVYWPVSGCRQSYSAKLNRLNILDENACRPAIEGARDADAAAGMPLLVRRETTKQGTDDV